jgi:hypothetical protein
MQLCGQYLVQAPQWLQMMGFLVSVSKLMARAPQAASQARQPMHLSATILTPPPSRATMASAGQAFKQDGFLQPMQQTTIKPVAMPPVVLTLMPDFDKAWLFWLTAAHTCMQLKQPRHLFISFARKILAIKFLCFLRCLHTSFQL